MDKYWLNVIENAQKKACEKTPCDVDTYVLHILGNVKGEGKYVTLDDELLELIKNSKTFENFKVNVIKLKEYIEKLDDESREGYINMVNDLIDTYGSPVSVDKKLPDPVVQSPQTVKAGGFSHRSRKKLEIVHPKVKLEEKYYKAEELCNEVVLFSLKDNDAFDLEPLIDKNNFPKTPEDYNKSAKRIVKTYVDKERSSSQYYRLGGLMGMINRGVREDPLNREIIKEVRLVPFECIDIETADLKENCDDTYWEVIYSDSDVRQGLRRANARRPISSRSRSPSLSPGPDRREYNQIVRYSLGGFLLGLYLCSKAVINPSDSILFLNTAGMSVILMAALTTTLYNNFLDYPELDGGGIYTSQINKLLLSKYSPDIVTIYNEMKKKCEPIIFEARKIIDILYNSRKEGGRSKHTKKKKNKK